MSWNDITWSNMIFVSPQWMEAGPVGRLGQSAQQLVEEGIT